MTSGWPCYSLAASGFDRLSAFFAGSLENDTPSLTGASTCWSSGPTAARTVRLAYPAQVRALARLLPFVRDARVSPTFQLLVKARLAGDDRVAIVRPDPAGTRARRAPALGLAAFVSTGVEHIGATPAQWHGAAGRKLPDGVDHILFLLALMLDGGGLARSLGAVSGFTLGHSITLALSAFHVVARRPG